MDTFIPEKYRKAKQELPKRPKMCPICNGFPREHKVPLGRTYGGFYSVYFKCDTCGCTEGRSFDDRNRDYEYARDDAIDSYNEKANMLAEHLRRVYSVKID